jgi:hypothetical protein
VLVVSDESFELLYGKRRQVKKQLLSSLKHWRLFKVIPIAEETTPELMVDVVAAAHRNPYCTIFPSRYMDAAHKYTEKFPHTKVVVTGSTERNEQLNTVKTDDLNDLYRAGQYIAFLSRERPTQTILVFPSGTFSDEQRLALQAGWKAHGEERFLVVVRDPSAIDYQAGGAIILGTGAVSSFLEQNKDIPIVLFSWLDPALTSQSVKVVFDDSVWTCIDNILKATEVGEISSQPIVLKNRITQKIPFGHIKKSTLML